MYFEFYLNNLKIEEPGGFSDLVQTITRDQNSHGVFFEATVSSLQFYGAAADYLREQKDTYGLKADVTFRALQSCGIYEELEELIIGKLDFGQYNRKCGEICLISLPVLKSGCTMMLRNRQDQKVDLDNPVAFDRLTALGSYDKLGEELSLPARAIEVMVLGTVGDSQPDSTTFEQSLSLGDTILMFRPTYFNEQKNSIKTGELIPTSPEGWIRGSDGTTFIDISPQLLLEDRANCFNDFLNYTFRLKGSFSASTPPGIGSVTLVSAKLKIVTWNADGNIFTNGNVIDSFTIATGGDIEAGVSHSFDQTFAASILQPFNQGLYAFLELVINRSAFSANTTVNVTFDEETSVDINTIKECPATTSNVYAINETLSRVVEAITNNCMKVKSDYYGRYDSQPYSSDDDGCGSLRVFTSGLYIRKAQTPKFFLSFKDAFEGLRAIDNIGYGVEPNPNIPGEDWVRIEEVDYFYKDTEVLRLPSVPDVEFDTEENKYYSSIKIGYKKWEAEEVNGLDEPNSNKDFRTDLNSVNNTLDLTSNFISATYVIETTRQQSFADSGGADTKYDNDTFIICTERTGYGDFIVERGNINGAANIFSPATVYNWRIRPWYNLMRWFKSLANSYANIDDSSNKLFFANGTGNLLAKGELADGAYVANGCKLENGVKAENYDMSKYDFQDQTKATPLFKPETAKFEYPLSIAELKQLKTTPYGYISFQCGDSGEWFKGYIDKIEARVAGDNQGKAEFNLRLKW